MMSKKKLKFLLIALIVLFSLTGCESPTSLEVFGDWSTSLFVALPEKVGQLLYAISLILAPIAYIGVVVAITRRDDQADSATKTAFLILLFALMLPHVTMVVSSIGKSFFNMAGGYGPGFILDKMRWSLELELPEGDANPFTFIGGTLYTYFIPSISNTVQIIVVILVYIVGIISVVSRNLRLIGFVCMSVMGWALFPLFHYILVEVLGSTMPVDALDATVAFFNARYIFFTALVMALCYVIMPALALLLTPTVVDYVAERIRHRSHGHSNDTDSRSSNARPATVIEPYHRPAPVSDPNIIYGDMPAPAGHLKSGPSGEVLTGTAKVGKSGKVGSTTGSTDGTSATGKTKKSSGDRVINATWRDVHEPVSSPDDVASGTASNQNPPEETFSGVNTRMPSDFVIIEVEDWPNAVPNNETAMVLVGDTEDTLTPSRSGRPRSKVLRSLGDFSRLEAL